MSINILVGGDVYPSEENRVLFENGSIEKLFGSLVNEFASADYCSVNLECALTHTNNPIYKAGPNLKSSPESINGISALGIDLISMSNNHILDYGEVGLADTLDAINSKSIEYVGVGKNKTAARRIHYKDIKGKKIAFIAVCEHEFTVATETSAGANLFDPYDTIDDIEEASKYADVVIVFYHGGKEHYKYPSPRLQKLCRALADRGADYIFCQHSHCIGSYEQYKKCHILYGQGDFIMGNSIVTDRTEGLLIKIKISEKNEIEFLPVKRRNGCVDFAAEDEKQAILRAFDERSKNLQDKEFLAQEWKKFCLANKNWYYSVFDSHSRIVRGVDRKLFHGALLKKGYDKGKSLNIFGVLICEAHLELLQTLFEHDYLSQ